MSVRRTRLAGALACAAFLLALTPVSAEAISVSGTAAPTNLKAGAHSDFKIHIAFSGGSVKDLTIGLPPGEIGDPSAAPFCSVAQLNADSCPANTMVGTASTMINLLGLLPNPLPVTGNVYNVAPHPGEPARFGIALHALTLPAPLNTLILPPVILQSGVQVNQSTFGLDTIVKNIPQSATLLSLGGLNVPVPISIASMDLSLSGIAPGTGKPFLRNPTSCSPLHATFTAVPTNGLTAVTPSPPFTLTGCGKLPFSPSFKATLVVTKRRKAGEAPTLTTAINQGNGEAGLKTAKVFIPPDMGANLNRLTPDQVCSQASFAASNCPAISVLGSAMATSPLISAPLSGPVELLENPNGVAKIGLDLHGQLNLKIQGQLGIDNTTAFTGLPDIPISHFALTFDGGPSGLLLTSRDICLPPKPVFHVNFAGYNGAKTSVDQPAAVRCGGVLAKCKKGKKHAKHRAAEAAKKHEKGCKKRKKKR